MIFRIVCFQELWSEGARDRLPEFPQFKVGTTMHPHGHRVFTHFANSVPILYPLRRPWRDGGGACTARLRDAHDSSPPPFHFAVSLVRCGRLRVAPRLHVPLLRCLFKACLKFALCPPPS